MSLMQAIMKNSILSDEVRHYCAFLSYSHTDSRPASRLHHWLETYKIPKRALARSDVAKRTLSPIFRDRAELPASSSLDREVREALAASEALLVLCSPEAQASRWVNEEITLFRKLHPDRPVIAAILKGEPADCFPRALLEAPDQSHSQEPIAADFRPQQDGSRLARLKIVAGLSGIPLDRIIQRDAQRQVRRVMAITAAALILVLALGLMLLSIIEAKRETDAQRQRAEGLIEFMLTDLRGKLQGVGRLDVLQSVNAKALAYYASDRNLDALPPESLERRARALHAMGEDELRRGDEAKAISQFKEAYRTTSTLLAYRPEDPQLIYAHAQSEFWLGYVDFMHDRNDQALPRFKAYQSMAAKLVELRPKESRYWRELAFAHGNMCTIEVTNKKGAEAVAVCEHALAAMVKAIDLDESNVSLAIDIANRHAWLADAFLLQGAYTPALTQRQLQSGILKRLIDKDPLNAAYLQDWILARYSMSDLLNRTGNKTEALKMRTDALRDVARLVAKDPENRDWQVWQDKLLQPWIEGE
jgi:hypothetical protein